MSLKSRFLTLSIKEQIFITIIALTFFCVLVILGICCTLIYEFFKDDYKTKKLYFYNKYKDYIESCFYFHNFCFLRYEEILRRLQKQAWRYHHTLGSFNEFTIFDNYSKVVLNYSDSAHKNISKEKTNKNNYKLFLLSYLQTGNTTRDISIYKEIYQNIIYNYQTLDNLIISPDGLETFHIPGYNIPVIETPLFININYSIIFSFNATNIHEMLIKIQGDSTNINGKVINKYYYLKLEEYLLKISYIYNNYFSHKLNLFFHMFNKSSTEIDNTINNGIKVGFSNEPNFFITLLLEYFSIIDFSNSKFSVLSLGSDNTYYYFEANILRDYLYLFNKGLGIFIDTFFIPLFFENSTIISPGLCIIFMLKQEGFQFDNKTFNEFNKTNKKGKSIFENCFIYKDLIKSQQNINDILNINSTNFFTVNNYIYQGIIDLIPDDNDFPYYFMKFSYPNYNVLKDFKSEYLLLDQIDYYLFTSFKAPIKYSNFINQIYQNCFFIIILSIVYIWLILLFINLLIFNQIIKDLIEPIIKLQYSVETSSLKDESIFNYEYDNIINQLFGTCKELLSGQIENNENGLNNFNILSIPKDKDKNIDTNIYKKNFIINNEKINELINEQQNMMDYSNNIKLYEPNEMHEKSKNFKKTKSNNNIYKSGRSENNLMHLIDKNSKDIINKKTFNRNSIFKNLENKDRESYKKIFKIAEYLNYYRNKNYQNNIIIIGNNSNIDDSKTSKIKYKNNGSIKRNISLKKINSKTDIRENYQNNENIQINMLDEQDISYLWYMEAKKKNNKSFNYNINYNFDELFNDFNDSHEHKRVEKKKK